MSYVPEVTARWKRRADEIAEAIGDELNVTGTVSVINDMTLSTATITALASAITSVLNPTDIAAAIYALTMPVSVVSTNTTPVHVQVRNIAGGFTAMGSDISTSMKLTAQPVSIADTVNVKTATNQAVAITGSVNLNVGTATVPVSNPNNVAVPVVNSNSVTVPVSLGSVTVPIKATAAGIPQNASGVSVYVPVDGNHAVTVPVSVGSATVPVRVVTNTSQGASSFGTGVVVPVSGGIASVPVNNTAGLTVQISGGTASVPVANTNSVTVPVRTVIGTTNAADGTGAAVVVPVNASGVVVDVNIATVADLAKTKFHEAMETALNEADDIDVNIATVADSAKTQFHEAMETALNEATGINAAIDNHPVYGGPSATDIADAIAVNDAESETCIVWFANNNAASTGAEALLYASGQSWQILKGDGSYYTNQVIHIPGVANVLATGQNIDNYKGRLVRRAPTYHPGWWFPIDRPVGTVTGVITAFPNYVGSNVYNGWTIRRDDGVLLHDQYFTKTNNSPANGQDFLLHNGKAVQFQGGTNWQEIRMA